MAFIVKLGPKTRGREQPWASVNKRRVVVNIADLVLWKTGGIT